MENIKGYLQEVEIIGLDGKSAGEMGHVIFNIIYPFGRSIYLDTIKTDLDKRIIDGLLSNDIIPDANYSVTEEDGYVININKL